MMRQRKARKKEKTCGDCWKHLVIGECPRAEYNNRKDNLAACWPTDHICSEFEAKAKKKKKEKRSKPTYKDSGISDDGYFEAIYHNDKPGFLVLNRNTFSVVETVSWNGKTFKPKEKNRIPYESYGYFNGDVPNREELFWKVRNEFQTFIDLESIWMEVLSACVLLSYHQEKLLTVPYIYVYGDNESGKSKTVREKDVTVKAYEFHHEKLRRVAKKYGYELVTKLPLLPFSEGAQAPDSTLKTVKNNVEKSLDTPVENGNISNSVTKPKSIDEMFASQKGSNAALRDLEDVLRRNWQKGTTEDLYKLIHKKSNLDRAETGDYVAKLIEEGKIAYDPDGWLKWLK